MINIVFAIIGLISKISRFHDSNKVILDIPRWRYGHDAYKGHVTCRFLHLQERLVPGLHDDQIAFLL